MVSIVGSYRDVLLQFKGEQVKLGHVSVLFGITVNYDTGGTLQPSVH